MKRSSAIEGLVEFWNLLEDNGDKMTKSEIADVTIKYLCNLGMLAPYNENAPSEGYYYDREDEQWK